MSGEPHCQETLDKLHTFLDRQLSEDDLVVVRYHLDRCPPCHHLFRFEERVRRLVKRSCAESAPSKLREQILARMRTTSL